MKMENKWGDLRLYAHRHEVQTMVVVGWRANVFDFTADARATFSVMVGIKPTL